MNTKLVLKWLFVINITSFLIGMFDPIIWRTNNSFTGYFPIIAILGFMIALIVGLLYVIVKLITSEDKKVPIVLLVINLLSFAMPVISMIGGFLGLFFGFLLVGI